MQYLVINNPASGRSGHKNETALRAALAPHDAIWVDTHLKQSLAHDLEPFINKVDYVVVSGGDGTLNDTIHAIKTLNSDVPLLIYPTGTTNEFAQHRNLTQERCIKAIKTSNYDSISSDAGWVDHQRWFIYSLSFGTITKLSYMTPQKYKNKLGYLGYWVYGFISRMWMKMKDYEMDITLDGVVHTDQYLFGSVTNSYSLGSVLMLDADKVAFDDGMFEVMLIKKPTKLRHYKEIISGLITKNYQSEYITFTKAKHIVIDSKRKVSWNLDGEFYARSQTIDIAVVQGAIQC